MRGGEGRKEKKKERTGQDGTGNSTRQDRTGRDGMGPDRTRQEKRRGGRLRESKPYQIRISESSNY